MTIFKKARGLFGTPSSKTAPPAPATKKPSTTHHAVSIVPGPTACPAARALRRHRFLSREAPALPLKDCGRDDCTCRYEHYEDRRAGARRARDMGVAVDGWVEEDRRGPSGKRGRRSTEK